MSNRIDTIAFGSCNRQWYPQDHWETVRETDADLWIWLGDNVYADTEDIGVMRSKYRMLYTNATYKAFRESVDIIGTWDDHDYGKNDGGRQYPVRAESQGALLDFLDEPAQSTRRRQAGVYTSYDFGPADAQVRVILLDTRYHRDRPGPKTDILGVSQWAFLKDALSNCDAQLVILASSIQVIPEDHRFEKWTDHPASRRRLFELIRTTHVAGLLLISGDRHIHEMSILNPPQVPYPLIEVTSSGITHAWKRFPGEPNRHRIGDVFHRNGFGLIEIDWDAEIPSISLQFRDNDGTVQRRLDIPISALEVPASD